MRQGVRDVVALQLSCTPPPVPTRRPRRPQLRQEEFSWTSRRLYSSCRQQVHSAVKRPLHLMTFDNLQMTRHINYDLEEPLNGDDVVTMTLSDLQMTFNDLQITRNISYDLEEPSGISVTLNELQMTRNIIHDLEEPSNGDDVVAMTLNDLQVPMSALPLTIYVQNRSSSDPKSL